MIGFYFNGGGGKEQLPVNPEKLSIKRSGNNQRTEVVLLGEINILRDAKLATISFDFLLPGADYYPFIVGPWKEPDRLRKYFDGLLKDGKSVRLTISDIGINQRVSVESFTANRIAGDHESLSCSISLLEYRSYSAKTLVIPPQPQLQVAAAALASRPVDKPQASTYVVKPGDSPWRIAQQQLGNGSRYQEVMQVNGLTAASVIHPGDVLKLPSR